MESWVSREAFGAQLLCASKQANFRSLHGHEMRQRSGLSYAPMDSDNPNSDVYATIGVTTRTESAAH